MKYEVFFSGVVQFPFRGKPLVSSVLIVLLIFSAALTVAAYDDTPQISLKDSRQLIKQAEKLTRKGEMLQAEEILRRVLKLNSQDTQAKLALAYILMKKRQLVEAYDFSFEVAKAEPKNSFAYAVLGATLLNAGNFRNAKISYISALQINRTEALAWAGLGMLDFYENRIYDSLENLREAVYHEPNDPDFVFALAQVSARAENYKEAAAAYEKFLQISPQTDEERRDRIKGLISFLRFLGIKSSMYNSSSNNETKISFQLINNRPVVKLKINDKAEPLNFILDTGSGISVISRETAKKLKIKPVARGGLARAIGGNGKFEIVYGFLKNISIGEVKIKNVPVYVREFHSQGDQVDGYIGLSLISKFLTTVDYGTSTFTLKRKDANSADKSVGEVLSLPLRLTSSGFLSGEVQLEGVQLPLNFIVDTGASISVISNEIAGLKEISQFITNDKMNVVGAAGITHNVSSFLLPRVTFGTHSRESVAAIALDLNLINEASGFEQAGILGGNFLKNYSLTFDFANSKVIFVPIKK